MNGIYDHPRCLVQKERILGEASRRNIPRIPTSNNDRKDGGELGGNASCIEETEVASVWNRPVPRTVSHCYRGGGKAFIGVHHARMEPVSISSLLIRGGRWWRRGRGTARGNLKDAFYGGTRRARNRKCVLHLSSPGGRFIVHHRLDGCELSASLRAFHSGRGSVSFRYRGRGIFTPSIKRAPRNASNVLRNLLSTYMRILPTLYGPDSWDWNDSSDTRTPGAWMLLGQCCKRRSF